MTARKMLMGALLAIAAAMPISSANAFWGGSWMPWNWFDNDYYYPYGGYGYPGYWGGYPGYGWGGYPGYGGWGGYPGYGGGYPGYGGWGGPWW